MRKKYSHMVIIVKLQEAVTGQNIKLNNYVILVMKVVYKSDVELLRTECNCL